MSKSRRDRKQYRRKAQSKNKKALKRHAERRPKRKSYPKEEETE